MRVIKTGRYLNIEKQHVNSLEMTIVDLLLEFRTSMS